MKIHGNAQLTIAQRKLIQELYRNKRATKSELARRFNVNRKTIDRWASRNSPYDKPSGPKEPRKVITEAYRQAVIDHRKTHPNHGAITIAYYLKTEFSFANRGTVQRILQEEKLSRRTPTTQKRDAL